MNPEAAKFLAIFIPLFLASILFIAFKLVYAAGKAMAEAKSIDPVSVGIVILILVLVGVGIRYYPPWIGRVAIDSFRDVWGLKSEVEEIITEVINDSSESWNAGNNDAPVTISQPTPEFTSTPMPTIDNRFEATATAYFEGTAEPTATPRPTIEPTRTPIPSPTVFLCRSTEDILAGCQPPTPIPGN